MRALVIGHTGGIGAALADTLAGQGAEVTGLSRAQGFDATDPARAMAALDALERPFDAIWVAIGVLAPPGGAPEKSLSALDPAALARVHAVNALGPALVLRAAPRLLPRRGRATLAVLSARVGSIGDNHLGGWHSYRASKAALNQLLRGAAIELRRTHPDAIAVALHPGTVATRFTAAYPAHDKLTPDESARRLIGVVASLTPSDTGSFRDHRGEVVPW